MLVTWTASLRSYALPSPASVVKLRPAGVFLVGFTGHSLPRASYGSRKRAYQLLAVSGCSPVKSRPFFVWYWTSRVYIAKSHWGLVAESTPATQIILLSTPQWCKTSSDGRWSATLCGQWWKHSSYTGGDGKAFWMFFFWGCEFE